MEYALTSQSLSRVRYTTTMLKDTQINANLSRHLQSGLCGDTGHRQGEGANRQRG